jgi:shikimate dehydrogenase
MREVRRNPAIDGLLVTMPHKRSVTSWLDHLTDTARRLGSVNTVKRLDGYGLVGAQFDGEALVAALARRGVAIVDKRVTLIGTGAAGAAIAEAVARAGPRQLDLVDIDHGRARAAATAVTHWTEFTSVNVTRAIAPGSDILINSSPVGMNDGDSSPVPVALLRPDMAVADIVADPPHTALAALATAVGALLVTGRDMVEAQVEPIARWLASDEPQQ